MRTTELTCLVFVFGLLSLPMAWAQSPITTDSTQSEHYKNFLRAKAGQPSRSIPQDKFHQTDTYQQKKTSSFGDDFPIGVGITAGLGGGTNTADASFGNNPGGSFRGYTNTFVVRILIGNLFNTNDENQKVSFGWLFEGEGTYILGGSFKILKYRDGSEGFRTGLYPIFDGTRYITEYNSGTNLAYPTAITNSEQFSSGQNIMGNVRLGLRIPFNKGFIAPYIGGGLGGGSQEYKLKYSYSYYDGSSANGQATMNISGFTAATKVGVATTIHKWLFLDASFNIVGGGFLRESFVQHSGNLSIGLWLE